MSFYPKLLVLIVSLSLSNCKYPQQPAYLQFFNISILKFEVMFDRLSYR